MIKQFATTVVSRKLIAENTHEITFAVTRNDFVFMAGQYVTVTIPSLSALPIKQQFRDFSVVSSANDRQEVTVAFRDSDSLFKQALLDIKSNGQVEIEGPKGIFYLPEETDRKIVFIAGGIGIAPFMSMIRTAAENHWAHRITLFYYNASKKRAAYLAELAELASLWGNLSVVSVTGAMNEVEIVKYLATHANRSSLWYIAGPPGMVLSARNVVRQQGVTDDTIKTEEFTGYV